MTKPQSSTTKPYVFNSHILTFSRYTVSVSIILHTPFEQFDTRLVWNLKFSSTLLFCCAFNLHDITEAPDQTDSIHSMKAESIRVCFDTFY